ncbi:hypothetical protein ScPMuIL_001866 [Solemya velum]
MNQSVDMNESDIFRRQRQARMSLDALVEGDTPMHRGREMSKTFKRRSTNVNFQKSLQLLDESVGGATPRGHQGPGGGYLRHSTYTPKHVSSGSKFDVTGLLGPTPDKSGLIDMSMNTVSDFYAESIMEEDVTTTNVGLLLEEDPGISASQGLYNDFLQCLQNNSSQQQVFDLVQEFENACRDEVTLLNKLLGRATKQQEKFRKTGNVLHLLKEETATWTLVGQLFRERVETDLKEMGVIDEEMAVDSEDKIEYQSDQNIMKMLFTKESSIRESQIVVDWLESCAREQLDAFSDKVKFFSDRAVAWENTLHRLQNQQTGLPMGTERPLVDEMDPDAPVRQNRMLDDLDKEDETRLLQYVFVCIRAGQIDKAQEICQSCGQSWRAATLEGWRLYHDPNFEGLRNDGCVAPVRGNPYRDIWKTVCWKMAQEAKFNQWERAIYASLSGNLQALLPVCKSWKDYLWAYFKVLVDSKVEQEIRIRTISSRPLEPLPSDYWEKMFEPITIFQEIETAEKVAPEISHWYCVIQKYLILGDTDKLLEVMSMWVRQDGEKLPGHLVRFMAHLVLFLQTAEHKITEDYCHVILEAYVQNLIVDKQKHLVASYVSKLSQNSQVLWYARFLEGINSKAEREECLKWAQEAGLDIPLITKTVVENIRNKDVVDFSQELEGPVGTTISDEDRQKIEAIDWLVFEPSQRAEAMKQANAVMRTFIAVRKHAAVKEVFGKLPGDSVDVVYKNWQRLTGSTDLPPSDMNGIREYMCMKAYIDAIDNFNDWFNLCHHGKPHKPEILTGASFTDRVAHDHRIKQYEQEVDRWHHNLMLQTKSTKARFYNVLLFADGGWMVDLVKDDEAERSRQLQMSQLRTLTLPYMCSLLHKVLHTTEQFTECLQLADLVSSEQHKLYEVFRKDELQKLLDLLRESSLAVLDLNRDPLGYELP